jgi:hypothetical protein
MNRGGSFANTLFINKSHGLHVGAWRQKTGSEKPPCEQRQRQTLWALPLCATESSPLYLQTDLLAVYDAYMQAYSPRNRDYISTQRPGSNFEDYRPTSFELSSPLLESMTAAAGAGRE